MRSNAVLCILGVLLFLCSAVVADEVRWGFMFTEFYPLGVYGQETEFGTSADATDGYNPGLDFLRDPGPVLMGAFHAEGPDWLGQTGLYMRDLRATLLPGEEKSWEIYISSCWDYVQHVGIDTMPLATGYSELPPANWQWDLYLEQIPAGVDYTGPTHWTEPSEIILPAYPNENYLEGYKFIFTMHRPVPEPGGWACLAGFVVTAVGLARRRGRKG